MIPTNFCLLKCVSCIEQVSFQILVKKKKKSIISNQQTEHFFKFFFIFFSFDIATQILL
jgi:hypothetical protein